MKEIVIIGDPHSYWPQWLNIIMSHDNSVCLGDLGLGLMGYFSFKKYMPKTGEHYIVRGNHDNPDVCKENKYCLNTYGSLFDGDMFYIAGATVPPYICSPEKWGDKEQLSLEELDAAIDLYTETKPLVVVSHEAPGQVAFDIQNGRAYPNRTSSAMDRMLYAHKPNKWIFGHHHKSYNRTIDGCKFIGLDILETHIVRL